MRCKLRSCWHDARRRLDRGLRIRPVDSLRKYLLSHDDLPDRPLIAAVPVSVHGKAGAEGINQVSNMFVRLPVDNDDPVEGLQTTLVNRHHACCHPQRSHRGT